MVRRLCSRAAASTTNAGVDATKPKLKAAFFQPGGGLDNLELVLDSNDPEFALSFQSTGTPRMGFGALKDGAPVVIEATYNGARPVVGQTVKVLAPKISLKAIDGHTPAMSIDLKDSFKIHIAPMIPPIVIGLGALLLLVLGIVVAVMKSGKQPAPAATETPKAEGVTDAPHAPEQGTGAIGLPVQPAAGSDMPPEPPAPPDSGASEQDWESRNQF